ncbi:Fc.00g116120.m01.CDS01 [Cosmosporella sp. VM-42]
MAPQRYTSSRINPKPLGSPLHFAFSGRTAQNRLMKAAMAENLSTWNPNLIEARGIPTKELINVYHRWGEIPNNFGLIVTGNIVTEYDHLEAVGNPIITPESDFKGSRFDAFKELASAAKTGGGLVVGQVCHPGRQVISKIQDHPISASAIQLKDNSLGLHFAKPRAATEADIARITTGFVHAAEYLEKAGFDGIQLHAAHGFLLAQFLSQSTNHRQDRYGGNLANRAGLILEIARQIRKQTAPGFILGIKINSVEFQEQGFSPDEARELCTMLESATFDFVEISGGTYEQLAFEHRKESTRAREAFFIEFAEVVVASRTKIRAYITGGLRSARAMVAALDVVDGVGLAKPAAQEPGLGRDIIEGKVTGALKPVESIENSFPVSSVAVGTLIRQLGKGQVPFDTTDNTIVQGFLEDMQQWFQRLQADTTMELCGYPDLTRYIMR